MTNNGRFFIYQYQETLHVSGNVKR